MIEKIDYLLCIERELYTIKIHPREEGHYICFYQIVTSDEYQLRESATKKILLRLIHAIHLHKDQMNEIQINTAINDLEILSKKLKIPEEYAKTKILEQLS